jgi:hypothetical protein
VREPLAAINRATPGERTAKSKRATAAKRLATTTTKRAAATKEGITATKQRIAATKRAALQRFAARTPDRFADKSIPKRQRALPTIS